MARSGGELVPSGVAPVGGVPRALARGWQDGGWGLLPLAPVGGVLRQLARGWREGVLTGHTV